MEYHFNKEVTFTYDQENKKLLIKKNYWKDAIQVTGIRRTEKSVIFFFLKENLPKYTLYRTSLDNFTRMIEQSCVDIKFSVHKKNSIAVKLRSLINKRISNVLCFTVNVNHFSLE